MIEDSQMEVVAGEEEEEEEIGSKKYPSLPSNYVSLAQLQERWLQQQQQKQKQKQKEELEKEELQKADAQTTTATATSSQKNQRRPEKLKKEKLDRLRNRNGERRIEGRKVEYVPRRRVPEGGNCPVGIRVLELGGSSGVGLTDGRVMENKIRAKEKMFYNCGKRRAKKMTAMALIGREDENLGKVDGENGCLKGEGSNWGESQRNDTAGKDTRAEKNVNVCSKEAVDEGNRGKEVNFNSVGVCRRNGDDEWGRGGTMSGYTLGDLPENVDFKEGVSLHLVNGDDQALGIEHVASVCMAEVLPANVGEEGVSVGNGKKYGRVRYKGHNGGSRKGRPSKEEDGNNERFVGGVRKRNGNDDSGVGGSVSGCTVEDLPESGKLKEEVPVHLLNGNDQALGIAEVADVCTVEVLPENAVEGGVSACNGRKYGQGRFRGRKGRFGKGRASEVEDGKVQSGEGKNGKEIKEKALIGKSKLSGDQLQKGKTRRGIEEASAYNDGYSGGWRPNIRRDFNALSLDDGRVRNATSTRRQRGGLSGRDKKLRDGDLIWVKKGKFLKSSNETTQVS